MAGLSFLLVVTGAGVVVTGAAVVAGGAAVGGVVGGAAVVESP